MDDRQRRALLRLSSGESPEEICADLSITMDELAVVTGSVALLVDGVEGVVESGGAAVVPPNTPHSVRVIGPAEVLVTDFPVRERLPGVS